MSSTARLGSSSHRSWRGPLVAMAVVAVGSISVTPAVAATTAPAGTPSAVRSAPTVDTAADAAASKVATIRMVVGAPYVDTDGNTWRSETGFRGGATTTTSNPIVRTRKDPLYQRERYNVDGYDIPLSAPGTYRTTLNLAETWFTGPGMRVFDVQAEGAAAVDDVDIFALSGATNTPYQLSFDSVVTDGSLTLGFTDVVNYAKVNSIRVQFISAPPPPPPPAAYSKVASIYQNPGESWADACLRTMTYGYTGCVRYFGPGYQTQWDWTLQELAAKAGDRRVDIQLTAKTHDHAGLASVLSQVPAAWKPTFIYNIFQEPEDNLLTEAEQAAWRASYTDAATVTREYGFQLPWIELQEWGVNDANGNGWNTAAFFPPAVDYQGVLWSLFEFNQRDLLDEQVQNITDAMAEYAPGKPWGLMAAEYALPVADVNEVTQQAQAAWLSRAHDLTRAAGSQSFAWFNMLYNNGRWTEGRVEENPGALAALLATPV